MPRQREIAEKAGVAQATVSMALRNHPSINAQTRERVQRAAKELGYRPNVMVSSLMAHIRSGRRVKDQGCLALVIGRSSLEEWLAEETYRHFHEGIQRRAEALGYHTECFFLEKGASARRLDRVLYSRGIVGVLLAPPQDREKPPLTLRWERYAVATISYTYRGPNLHRVSPHHRHNVNIAFRELVRKGYRRVGLCIPQIALHDFDDGWISGFVYNQWKHFPKASLPPFIEVPGVRDYLKKFAKWLDDHRPDVLLTLTGGEKAWLDALGRRVPEEIGIACLNRPPSSPFSGVEENQAMIGEGAVDLLVGQIQANERGLPLHPKCLAFDGTWVEGETLRSR